MKIEHRYDPWADRSWAENENASGKRSRDIMRNRYQNDPEYREAHKARNRARYHATKDDDAIREAKRRYARERYKARIAQGSGLTVREREP